MEPRLKIAPDTRPAEGLTALLRPVAREIEAVRTLYREFLLSGNGESNEGDLEELADYIRRQTGPQAAPVVVDVARHVLRREGKWLRAAIVELVAKMFDRTGGDTTATAAAVELIHVATLIHDDIVDNAELRRGQASVPAQWGISISVLVGDFLYAKAFGLLAELDCPEAIRCIARSTRDVALGEIQEMRFFGGEPVTQEDYFRMVHNKTASLFGACAEAGAHLAWKNTEIAEQCRKGAIALGIAFQIADDILDLSSTEEDLGKDTDADWKNGKMTLPLLLLKEAEPGFLESALGQDTVALHSALSRNQCLERASEVARRECAHAKEHFSNVSADVVNVDCYESLVALCDFVVNRKR